MSYTLSNMLPLGTKAPDFELLDVISNKKVKLDDLLSDRATVIMFICNHCPYVHFVNEEMVNIANEYIEKGVSFIGINSNDVDNYPEDRPEKMVETAIKEKYPFPYLFDETQEVGKSYDAACTPDFYIFDGDALLRYRGQMDGYRPSSEERPNGKDLREALDAVLEGREVSRFQRPSGGCNIKWKN